MLRERAVGLQIIGVNVRSARVAGVHVERLFVGRKGDAIRVAQLGGEQRDFPAGEPIHPAEGEFLDRRLLPLGQAIRRVGEKDVAVLRDGQVVRTVETLAVVAVGERGFFPVLFQPRDPPHTVLAKDQPPLGIARETVRSRLAKSRRRRRATTRLAENFGSRRARLPAVDDVFWYVGKHHPAVEPHRSLRPAVAFREFFHHRVRRQYRVERRVEPLDAKDGAGLVVGEDQHRGEEQEEEMFHEVVTG